MRTSTAAVGSAMFFIVAPGTVVGLIPWLISHWEFHQPAPHWVIAQVIGALLICVGLVPAVSAFVEFVKAGGTPMPVAPPQRLVVSGFNRYIRNPMYFGLLLVIIGEALLFGSLGLLVYAVLVWAAPAAFVRWYEQPALIRQFGAEYQAYRQAVPAWWPRLRPYTPSRNGIQKTPYSQ
jgi:protein-S-isoprenylcysteine O-methyltransferase Ste14